MRLSPVLALVLALAVVVQIPAGMSTPVVPVPRTTHPSTFAPMVAPPGITWAGNISVAFSSNVPTLHDEIFSSFDPNTNAVWVQEGSSTELAVINDSGMTAYQAQIAEAGDDGTGVCFDTSTHGAWLTSSSTATSPTGSVFFVNDNTFVASELSGPANSGNSWQCATNATGNQFFDAPYNSVGAIGQDIRKCSATACVLTSDVAFAFASVLDPALNAVVFINSDSGGYINAYYYDTNTLVASSSALGNVARALCYDPQDGYVYAPYGGTVMVISLTPSPTLIATIGLGTNAAVDNPECTVDSSGNVFITNQASGTVSIVRNESLLETIHNLDGPLTATYDPHTNAVYIGELNTSTVTVIELAPTVTISETGLPAGRNWSASVGTTPGSGNSTSIAFSETTNAGTLAWTVNPVAPPPGCSGNGCAWWAASPANGTITVTTSPVTVSVHYTWGSWITVTETGLPERVLGCLPSGCSYITDVPWWWNSTSCPGTCGTADESLSWSALAQNGTYVFTAASVGNWSAVPPPTLVYVVTVSAPYPVSVGVQFVWTTNLTFHETGLSKGTSWSVTLHYKSPGVTCPHPSIWCGVTNETLSSAVANVSFGHGFVANGLVTANVNGTDYTYTVNSPKGYTALPGTGNITLPDPVQITFLANATNSTNSTNGTGGGGGGSGGGGGGGSGGGGGGGGASSSGPQSLLQSLVSHGDWIWVIFVASVIVLALLFFLLDGGSRRKHYGRPGRSGGP